MIVYKKKTVLLEGSMSLQATTANKSDEYTKDEKATAQASGEVVKKSDEKPKDEKAIAQASGEVVEKSGECMNKEEATSQATSRLLELLDTNPFKVTLPIDKLESIQRSIKTSAPAVAQMAIKENRTPEEESELAFQFERNHGGDMGRLHNDTLTSLSRDFNITFPRYTDDHVKIARDESKAFSEQMFELWQPDQLKILKCGISTMIFDVLARRVYQAFWKWIASREPVHHGDEDCDKDDDEDDKGYDNHPENDDIDDEDAK